MDLNINVTLDPGTTKAIALLAESILAASTELGKTAAAPVVASPLAPSTPTEHAAKPPKKTRKPRTPKPAAAVEPEGKKEEGATSSPESEASAAPEKVTREIVRKAAGKFMEGGGDRQAIKDWLEEYGVESITTLDEKHLPEMYGKLTA